MYKTVNDTGTLDGNSAISVPPSPSEVRRLQREAKALAIVKSVRPKGHPEHQETIALRKSRFSHTKSPGTDPNAPGVVYFLYCAGHIKIGYTIDIKQRLNDYHTHSPMPVTLLLTICGWPEDEESYHEMFKAERVRREWFHPSLELREFLSCHFEYGTQELMWNAEEEAQELFEAAQQFWNQLETEMAKYDDQ